uniref:Uncharacterized protein n=1 Tax=Cacopsylla melanoneura TaxID=428564 RepID=A0A8D8R989_9HEMI
MSRISELQLAVVDLLPGLLIRIVSSLTRGNGIEWEEKVARTRAKRGTRKPGGDIRNPFSTRTISVLPRRCCSNLTKALLDSLDVVLSPVVRQKLESSLGR